MAGERIPHQTCSTCKETKPLSEFHRRSIHRERRMSACRPCTSLRSKAIRAVASQRILEATLAELPGSLSDEEWRRVVGFEDLYLVSSLGRVMSIGRGDGRKIGRIMKPAASGPDRNYLCLNLSRGARLYPRKVHALVALAFLGPKPTPRHEVNHKDGDTFNNRAENLEWVTHQQNDWHKVNVLGKSRGENASNVKLTEADVLKIRAYPKSISCAKIAAQFGVTPSNVWMIRHGVTWKHLLQSERPQRQTHRPDTLP